MSGRDGPESLGTMGRNQWARWTEIPTQQQVVAGLTEQLNTRDVEIEHLKLQIAKLRRMQFGRKSE